MKHKFVLTLIISLGITGSLMAELASDPWANSSPATDKLQRAGGTQNTLNNTLPNFVGENTTWNTAMGQKEIAPDVNITNMLLMTQHLRNMGYEIPDGLDNLINTAPEKLRRQIAEAMNQIKNSNHPIASIENNLENAFHKLTGLSLENLIMNSLRIMDSRR